MHKPKAALIFYEGIVNGSYSQIITDQYVEYHKIDSEGRMIDAHPLTVKEASKLAKALTKVNTKTRALNSTGIIPTNVLYFDSNAGSVVWYTPARRVTLNYSSSLDIETGEVFVPALLFRADRHNIDVFALKSDRRPNDKTKLFNAPFFNVNSGGRVCMGNVKVKSYINDLEQFIIEWEKAFFGSNFTHSLQDQITKSATVPLWKELHATGDKFPVKELLISRIKLQTLF